MPRHRALQTFPGRKMEEEEERETPKGVYIISVLTEEKMKCLRATQLLGYRRPDLLLNVEYEPRHARGVRYANNIRYSQEVSHPSNNRTRHCSTSLFLWEAR